MLFLFLRPGEALGNTTVTVKTLANAVNGEKGVPVNLEGTVDLESGTDLITLVTVGVTQNSGKSGFTAFSITAPVQQGDQTITLGAGQGTLVVNMDLTQVKQVALTGGNYAFAYDGGAAGATGGKIVVKAKYTPPAVAGEYTATIGVNRTGAAPLTDGTGPVSSSTTFSVLKPLNATALATLYPATEDGAALATDTVVLQLDLTDTKASDIFKTSVAASAVGGALPMVDAGKIHASLKETWGVSTAADLALPMRVISTAVPGTFGLAVTAEDIAGQVLSLSSTAGPQVKVVSSRSTFNLYLLPTFNFVTSPLQCSGAAPLCDSADEFVLAELLQQTVPTTALNPAFVSAISATGPVPLNKILQSAFRYDTSGFKFFDVASSSGGFDSIGVGRGYALKTTIATGNISPFKLNTSGSQFSTGVPVPIKLTLTGKFIADEESLPPSTEVSPKWNLVGVHSEVDASVGLFLRPVTVPEQTWETLIAFINSLDIDLDSSGKVRTLPGGESRIVFEKKFKTLLGPVFSPPAGETVPVGTGLWLYMCEAPAATCKPGELLPVSR